MASIPDEEQGVDAEIVFTGLRPGEKLHEELIIDGEDVSGTEKMPHEWETRLEELIVAAKAGSRLSVVEKLDALVKGYSPMYEFHGVPEATVDIEPDLPPLSPSLP